MQQSEDYELPRAEHSVALGPRSSLCSSAPSTSRDFEFISSNFGRRSTYFSGDITTQASQVTKVRRHTTVAPTCTSVHSWRCF